MSRRSRAGAQHGRHSPPRPRWPAAPAPRPPRRRWRRRRRRGPIAVKAADDACEVGGDRGARPATITFSVNNTGSKVTEFYLYGEGDRIMGEVENIGPGLTRQLIVEVPDGGTYTTACKPGMVGDGIRAPFTVTGTAPRSVGPERRSSPRPPRATSATSTRRSTRWCRRPRSSSTRSRRGDVDAGQGAVPGRRAPTGSGSSRWPSRSATSTRRSTAARTTSATRASQFTGYHRLEKDLWVDGLQPDSPAIADQLMADINELADPGRDRRADPGAAGQRRQGAARRGRHRQDHRRGGPLLAHRPVGLPGQRGGLAGARSPRCAR